jgi:excinuclease UvrABC helicase subunit UvrB
MCATGMGKTFIIANIITKTNNPTLVKMGAT